MNEKQIVETGEPEKKYLEDAQGRLVPVESIKPVDLARDALVSEIFAAAQAVRAALREFRTRAMADILAFADLSAEKYGQVRGGRKGNITLTSFDGETRVALAHGDLLAFDERLGAAKALIDECLSEWTEDSRHEVRALISDAFSVDKAGRINTARVLGLRRLKFEDPRWLAAMEAIADSLTVAATRSYIRVYKRDSAGDYQQVPLDLANA